MATYYITNHGNDKNDGLSLKTSWRTLSRVDQVHSNSHVYYLNGAFYDLDKLSYLSTRTFKGLNYAKIDGAWTYRNIRFNFDFENIEFYNFSLLYDYNSRTFKNCYFHNILKFSNNVGTGYSSIMQCVFNNVGRINYGGLLQRNINNTFHNCSNIYIHLNNTGYYYGLIKVNNIFSNSSIRISNKTDLQYSLFMNCSFRFYGGGLGNDESDVTYPTGATGEEKLQNLRDRMSIVYGGNASDYLSNCIYYTGSYNDIFIDADNDDFHLIPGCIATHMSNINSYIGAKQSIPITNLNDFTLTNVGTNGEILNDNTDSNILSNVIDLGKVKKIISFTSVNNLYHENGTQLNIDDVFNSKINASKNVLTNQTKYMAFNDNIFTDEAYTSSYEPHSTFLAEEKPIVIDNYGTSGNGLGFITYESGYVKEVLYNNTIEKFKLKCSKIDNTLTDAVELIMYTDKFPKVNIDRYGKPIIGNADNMFNESTSVDLYTRYIQYNIDIKANNIPSI